jgi:hypothetical protein
MDRYELVPELKAWEAHNGDEESPEGWASCVGTYSLAVAYAGLVWPQFVEIRGMVFRHGVTEQDVDGWLASTAHDRKCVEATINHLHILDIQHPGIWSDATETQLRFLGETLRSSWSSKLAQEFPTRKFVVEFIVGTAENPREYQVVFYEQREG